MVHKKCELVVSLWVIWKDFESTALKSRGRYRWKGAAKRIVSGTFVSPHKECPYKGLEVAYVDAAKHAITFLQAGYQNC